MYFSLSALYAVTLSNTDDSDNATDNDSLLDKVIYNDTIYISIVTKIETFCIKCFYSASTRKDKTLKMPAAVNICICLS